MFTAFPPLFVALLLQQARPQSQQPPAAAPTFARALTPQERAYLGAPLAAVARVVEAAIPCPQPASWALDATRDAKPDLDSPGSLVPAEAMLTLDGVMPARWQIV